jgi:16S rRNA (guanine527-N7)-methyltransferase
VSEEEAKERVRSLVDATGFTRLEQLVSLVLSENERQNLIARSTVAFVWSRHVLDSVQLLRWGDPRAGSWLDIGTGGGFPGLAVAAASNGETILVEPRRLRSAFLAAAVDCIGLTHSRVVTTKVEGLTAEAATISARAVAPVEKLLQAAGHCATPTTRWLFLRGRLPDGERQALARVPRLMFHVEQSLSDPESVVLIANRGKQ